MPLSKKGVVVLGRHSVFARRNRFAVLVEDICRSDRPVGETPCQRRHYAQVESIVLVAQVLALGVTLSRNVGEQTEHQTATQLDRHAALERVCLADFATRRKFENIDRIVPRTREHRAAHAVAQKIVVAEPSGERNLFQVVNRLHLRSEIPTVRRAVGRDELSVLLHGIHFGIRRRERIEPQPRRTTAHVPHVVAHDTLVTLLRRRGGDAQKCQNRYVCQPAHHSLSFSDGRSRS